MVTKYQVIRTWDGMKDVAPFVIKTFASENECFEWLHRNAAYSVHEAITNQGWSIRTREVKEREDENE